MKAQAFVLLLVSFFLTACAATDSGPSPSAPTVAATPALGPSLTAPASRIPSPRPATPSLVPTPSPVSGPVIVVDHNTVGLFEEIPEAYLAAAADLRMVYVDRSVGLNISEGLDCLASPSDELAKGGCRRREHRDPTYTVPAEALGWSHPGGYDRSKWEFRGWPEGGCGTWSEEIDCYILLIDRLLADFDVLSFQFSYLEVMPGSDIASPERGFFVDNPNRPDVFDLERFEAMYPDKTFIYWTTSLARAIGSEEARLFNDQMREYAISNGKPLFDVADILSHDPSGNPCFDNRDGITYRDEAHPDDGLDLPAICPHYTTETNGGHLGSVSVGKIRVAKAFWVLMAQIAGWEP